MGPGPAGPATTPKASPEMLRRSTGEKNEQVPYVNQSDVDFRTRGCAGTVRWNPGKTALSGGTSGLESVLSHPVAENAREWSSEHFSLINSPPAFAAAAARAGARSARKPHRR